MPKIGKAEAKPAKRPSEIAIAVAATLTAILKHAEKAPGYSDRDSPAKIEKFMVNQKWSRRLGKSQIYRWMSLEGGAPGVDKLALFARAFGLEAWHLLYPNFNIENQPVVMLQKEMDELIERKAKGELLEMIREWEKQRHGNAGA